MRIFFLSAFVCLLLSSAKAQVSSARRCPILVMILHWKLSDCEDEVGLLNDQFKQKQSDLDQEIAQHRLTKNQFDQTKSELDHTKNELDQTKIKINQEYDQHKQTKQQLSEANKQLDKFKQEESAKQLAARNPYNNIIKPEFLRIDEYYKEKADYTWVIQGDNRERNELQSNEFDLRGYPQKMMVKIMFDDAKEILEGESLIDGEKEGLVDIMVFPNIFFTIKDQSSKSTGEEKDRVTYSAPYFHQKRSYNTFLFYTFKGVSNIDALKSALYGTNDKVVIDIHVEPPEVAEQVYSYNGTLTWAVNNYRKRKQMAIENLNEGSQSPYFYTSNKGYRMQAVVYFNGYGSYENKGLSVELDTLSGRFDKYLNKQVSHQVMVTVFHPIEDGKKITKHVTANNNWYAIDMGSHEEIEKLVYEDTLYYRVTVS